MGWVLAMAAALVLAFLLGYLVVIYNGLVRLRHGVDRAWADIDVLPTQRHAELPKLVDTVRAYMQHERDVLHAITEARQRFERARSVSEKAEADRQVHDSFSRLVAVAEGYPELKADNAFGQLLGRISSLEESIADRRELFNHSVNLWNVRIDQFPDLVVAGLLAMREPRELFEARPAARRDVSLETLRQQGG